MFLSTASLLFARNFLKHPKMLGSIIPSSRFLIRQLLGRVDWDSARVIVEYGPGVGSITAEVLRQMRPDATLVAIEMNGDFVEMLKTTYGDSRLHVVQGSAADVKTILGGIGIAKADVVISGIPFSTLPPGVAGEIVRSTHQVLNRGGLFLVYQFSSEVLRHLRKVFKEVVQEFEPLNILPARLFYCRK